MDFLKHPGETLAMLRLAVQRRSLDKALKAMTANKKFCYDILVDVSRSFAAVIMELPLDLQDAVRRSEEGIIF